MLVIVSVYAWGAQISTAQGRGLYIKAMDFAPSYNKKDQIIRHF